jgi:hypothetical protein
MLLSALLAEMMVGGLRRTFSHKFNVFRLRVLTGHIVAVPAAQAVSRPVLFERTGFTPSIGHVGFVVDEVALGKVSSE